MHVSQTYFIQLQIILDITRRSSFNHKYELYSFVLFSQTTVTVTHHVLSLLKTSKILVILILLSFTSFLFITLSSAATITPIKVYRIDSHTGSKGAWIQTHIFLNSNLAFFTTPRLTSLKWHFISAPEVVFRVKNILISESLPVTNNSYKLACVWSLWGLAGIFAISDQMQQTWRDVRIVNVPSRLGVYKRVTALALHMQT